MSSSSVPVSIGIKRYLADLPHASVRRKPVVAKAHRWVIVQSLLIGFLSLAFLPLALAWPQPIDPAVSIVLALLACQAPLAVLLSATGWSTFANMLSSSGMAAAIAVAITIEPTLIAPGLLVLGLIVVEAVLAASVIAALWAVAAGVAAILVPALVVGNVDLNALYTSIDVSPAAIALASLGAVMLTSVTMRVKVLQQFAHTQIIERERRFQSFAAELPDTAMTLMADATVRYVTPSVAGALGLSSNQLLGRCFFERINVADRPALLRALGDALESGRANVDVRLNAQGAETGDQAPNWGWFELRLAVTTTTETGKSSAEPILLGILRSIEARKALEDEIDRARQLAEEGSMSKTQFFATVSHELRTPLNAILGFSDMLKQELLGKFEHEKQREYAELIHDSGTHLLQIVNDVLDVSRIEAGRFEIAKEPFNLADLIQNCCQIMGPQATRRHITLQPNCEPTLRELVADRRACRQMLLNLLHNAIKFSHEGGFVAVSARQVGATVEIRVIDQGIGIAAGLVPQLGRPFVQADAGHNRSHQGAGLGLSMVRGLVDLHDGGFTVSSIEGRGTTVRITLPLGDAQITEQTPAVVHLHQHRQNEHRQAMSA